MITVISSQEANVQSLLYPRFGRAKWFCAYNSDTEETTFNENPYIDSQGGAGLKTSEMVIEMGAKKVISGHFGPKAKALLDKFNIQLIEIDKEQSISELIDIIKKQ
jgi:predicted Fe-Mo cluster-binding NifX family protein